MQLFRDFSFLNSPHTNNKKSTQVSCYTKDTCGVKENLYFFSHDDGRGPIRYF